MRTLMLRLGLAALLAAGACAPTIEDPMVSLADLERGPTTHLAAMAMLDEAPRDDAYVNMLDRVIWLPGYTVEVRVAAVERLEAIDPNRLKRTLRQHLPRMEGWEALTRLSEIIAERGWIELTPALVSSLARPAGMVRDPERPEYLAIEQLHGKGSVPDVTFELLVTSNRVSDQMLRTRAWELLERLGARDRLIDLLQEQEVAADDAFLLDLKRGAVELSIVPSTREEILWMRKLLEPERQAFWDEARAATARLPEARRRALELRDVPVVVAAARHDPELLESSDDVLYERLAESLHGRKRYARADSDPMSPWARGWLPDVRDRVTWGDLAAMLLAVRALDVDEVVEHLFDYAERDRLDETTEYGGVVDLDAMGRFEILEFPPRVREHDVKFNASQEMLDVAYTAIFHFHLHAQKYRNADFAGPGYGDDQYADDMRANCLVMTFIDRDSLNVDFYRHGRVMVDLGVVTRR